MLLAQQEPTCCGGGPGASNPLASSGGRNTCYPYGFDCHCTTHAFSSLYYTAAKSSAD